MHFMFSRALSLLLAGCMALGPCHGNGRNPRDVRSDGICHDSDTACQCFVDENQDGLCDNRVDALCQRKDWGKGFVDENNDGVCDNRGSGNGYGCGQGNGQGNEKGHGQGHGRCRNR